MPNTKTTSLAAAQAAGLRFLASAQTADGSFLGQASPSQTDFSLTQSHHTPFQTSLIANCLAGLPGSESIGTSAARFIAGQRSADWSWNYWIRGSVDQQQRPYPDDLDDTVVALSALTAIDSHSVGGQALGALGRLLVSQETAVGGPYRTWLVAETAAASWRDIDLAVNANIGYLLQQHQVEAPGLSRFITAALRSGNLTSRYYDGPLPVLYFISRGYRASAQPDLQKLLGRHVRKLSPNNALHLSLLLTASSHVGLKPPLRLRRQLLALQQADGSWPAASLYYEPPIDKQPYYAGSPALTTAFALEALAAIRTAARPAAASTDDQISSAGPADILDKTDDLADSHRQYLQHLIAKDSAGQISAIATITAAACDRPVRPSILAKLNQASLNGWASYSLFDDILDHDSDASQLTLAMLALRRTSWYFSQALAGKADFQALVQTRLDAVDSANHWEQRHARAELHDGHLTITRLPDYADLGQLADRSIGHSLASCAVLLTLGIALDHPDQQALQGFYHHYLIARQLHDDAHDWQTDLARGQLSVVVCRLLSGYFDTLTEIDFQVAEQLPALKRYFWETTIESVIGDIERQIRLARTALGQCQIVSQPAQLLDWLNQLAASAARVRSERRTARQFINSYTGLHG